MDYMDCIRERRRANHTIKFYIVCILCLVVLSCSGCSGISEEKTNLPQRNISDYLPISLQDQFEITSFRWNMSRYQTEFTSDELMIIHDVIKNLYFYGYQHPCDVCRYQHIKEVTPNEYDETQSTISVRTGIDLSAFGHILTGGPELLILRTTNSDYEITIRFIVRSCGRYANAVVDSGETAINKWFILDEYYCNKIRTAFPFFSSTPAD